MTSSSRRYAVAAFVFGCAGFFSIAPEVRAAQTFPLGPFAAQTIGRCTGPGTQILRIGQTITVDVRDDSRGENVTASAPTVGQDPLVAIDFYDLTPSGAIDLTQPIISASGIQNGQSLPTGYPGVIYHYAPYGVGCVAGAALAGYGVLLEGQ